MLLKHAAATIPMEGPLRHILTQTRATGMTCSQYYDACMRQMKLWAQLEPDLSLKPKNFLGLWDAYVSPEEPAKMFAPPTCVSTPAHLRPVWVG